MTIKRLLPQVKGSVMLMAVMMICALVSAPALAGEDTLAAQHSAVAYGSNIDVTNTIEYTGAITALGFRAVLPEGFSFVSVSGAYEPDVKPKAGTAGTLEFAWITVPESVFSFTYTVAGPENASGKKEIQSTVLYRRMGEELTETVTPNPLSAD